MLEGKLNNKTNEPFDMEEYNTKEVQYEISFDVPAKIVLNTYAALDDNGEAHIFHSIEDINLSENLNDITQSSDYQIAIPKCKDPNEIFRAYFKALKKNKPALKNYQIKRVDEHQDDIFDFEF